MGASSCCVHYSENDEVTFGEGVYDFKKLVKLNLIYYFFIIEKT